jgi:hypothetical protein
MLLAGIERLLKENETTLMRERRSQDRKPFLRPVTIVCGRDHQESHIGFSRDLSQVGIGLISPEVFQPKSVATLKIHSLFHKEVIVSAEVRWCEPFGDGWYVSGWSFLREI